jgi:hypothetical protein
MDFWYWIFGCGFRACQIWVWLFGFVFWDLGFGSGVLCIDL